MRADFDYLEDPVVVSDNLITSRGPGEGSICLRGKDAADTGENGRYRISLCADPRRAALWWRAQGGYQGPDGVSIQYSFLI